MTPSSHSNVSPASIPPHSNENPEIPDHLKQLLLDYPNMPKEIVDQWMEIGRSEMKEKEQDEMEVQMFSQQKHVANN